MMKTLDRLAGAIMQAAVLIIQLFGMLAAIYAGVVAFMGTPLPLIADPRFAWLVAFAAFFAWAQANSARRAQRQAEAISREAQDRLSLHLQAERDAIDARIRATISAMKQRGDL